MAGTVRVRVPGNEHWSPDDEHVRSGSDSASRSTREIHSLVGVDESWSSRSRHLRECVPGIEAVADYLQPVSHVDIGGIRVGGVRPYFPINRPLPDQPDPERPDSSKQVNEMIGGTRFAGVSLPNAVTGTVLTAQVIAFGSSSPPSNRAAAVAAPRR
jgi:hypothetical protein